MPVIAGIQKLTLTDYPDRPACILFTRGCNFACPFCHNPSLIASGDGSAGSGGDDGSGSGVLPAQVIFDFLDKRRNMLDAVCISGGEPLAQESIIDFCARLKNMGYLVKIDTNGSNPGRLKALAASGSVDYVAMDIKNAFQKYPQTIAVPGYDTAPIEESIEFLLRGTVHFEFRTTVVRRFHGPGDIAAVARHIQGAPAYFLQRYEQSGGAALPGSESYSQKEMQEICELAQSILPCTQLR